MGGRRIENRSCSFPDKSDLTDHQVVGHVSCTSPIRLATRGSALARWQAQWIATRLQSLDLAVRLVPISTQGDRQQKGPIGAIGSPGVFTKEVQAAVLQCRADLAVHSLKDLPTDEVQGLCLAAVPERGPAGDALVCRKHGRLADLPEGAVLGTGSLRRRAQILHFRGDLRVQDIRGNVDTRLRKLDAGRYDALVLAEAGLRRLGLAQEITELLPLSVALPAVGQGALGLEIRAGDEALREVLSGLDHPPTHAAVRAERAMLAALQGGCLAPIAAWGRLEDGALVLTGRVLHPMGTSKLETTGTAEVAQPERLGRQVAEELIAQGAAELIRASREV